MDFGTFCNSARSLGFGKGLKFIYQSIPPNEAGVITLKEFCPA